MVRMPGDYSEEWYELRSLRKQLLRYAAGVVCILVVFGLGGFIPTTISKWIGIPLMLTWLFLLVRFYFLGLKYSYWACPRCGEPFHYLRGRFGHWNNPAAGKCVHCGLPKWVESDPDPTLKRELDPFRTDSIFKLSDP